MYKYSKEKHNHTYTHNKITVKLFITESNLRRLQSVLRWLGVAISVAAFNLKCFGVGFWPSAIVFGVGLLATIVGYKVTDRLGTIQKRARQNRSLDNKTKSFLTAWASKLVGVNVYAWCSPVHSEALMFYGEIVEAIKSGGVEVSQPGGWGTAQGLFIACGPDVPSEVVEALRSALGEFSPVVSNNLGIYQISNPNSVCIYAGEKPNN